MSLPSSPEAAPLLSLLLTTLVSTVTSHYSSSSSTPSPPQSSLWHPARATYYAASDPRDSVGGACGIKCRKEGGVRFTIDGSGIFVSVLISNVAENSESVANAEQRGAFCDATNEYLVA
ncbi:hypothetical protein V6N13_140576 [Hibiscus sabdariffa]